MVYLLRIQVTVLMEAVCLFQNKAIRPRPTGFSEEEYNGVACLLWTSDGNDTS